MNTKQIVVGSIGIAVVIAALALSGNRPTSVVISSRRITPSIGIIVVEDAVVPKAILLWSGAGTALTLGAVYVLRSRRPVSPR